MATVEEMNQIDPFQREFLFEVRKLRVAVEALVKALEKAVEVVLLIGFLYNGVDKCIWQEPDGRWEATECYVV